MDAKYSSSAADGPLTSEFGLVTSALTVMAASERRAGSVAKLVFRRSRGAGDSAPLLLLCGDAGGADGDLSGFAFGLTDSDSFSTAASAAGLSSSSSPARGRGEKRNFYLCLHNTEMQIKPEIVIFPAAIKYLNNAFTHTFRG